MQYAVNIPVPVPYPMQAWNGPSGPHPVVPASLYGFPHVVNVPSSWTNGPYATPFGTAPAHQYGNPYGNPYGNQYGNQYGNPYGSIVPSQLATGGSHPYGSIVPLAYGNIVPNGAYGIPVVVPGNPWCAPGWGGHGTTQGYGPPQGWNVNVPAPIDTNAGPWMSGIAGSVGAPTAPPTGEPTGSNWSIANAPGKSVQPGPVGTPVNVSYRNGA
jgi:hypothetical protein